MQLNLLEQKKLGQWFTPEWAAEELVEHFFYDLTAGDLVVEPSAGRGAFLKAIPQHVPAIGVEIDPEAAESCRENTGRKVITGNYLYVDLPCEITTVIGNPPFEVHLISSFVRRGQHLPQCRRMGFLLPAYAIQTQRRVMGWADHWSLRAEIVPRRIFPRLRLPLVFLLFTRDGRRDMIGFALYSQALEVDSLFPEARKTLTQGKPKTSAWASLVRSVLEELGGEGDLDQIYDAIAPRRPTDNKWWREKVRQQLQINHHQVGRGRWKT